METDKVYTIREVSEMFNIPVSTLRYYEDEGLLTNVGRSSTNQRIYYGRVNTSGMLLKIQPCIW